MTASATRRPGRRRPEADAPADAGMTVVELLVVIGLLSVLTVIVFNTAILAARTVDRVSTRLDNSTSGEVAMENITKTLRTAVRPGQLSTVCTGCTTYAFVAASPTRAVFYANLNNTGAGPARTTLEVVEGTGTAAGTGQLRVTSEQPVVAADGSYAYCTPGPGCTPTQRVVAQGLVWPSPTVFRYLDLGGAAVPGSPVAGADLAKIASVDVQVQVRTKTGARYTTASLQQRVRLPNAEITVQESTP